MDTSHMAANPDFEALAEALSGEVCTDDISRYLLSTDGSIFRKMPAAVVYPRTTDDVVKTVRFAAANGLSVHGRGSGSGLCGSCLGSGVIIDFSRFMNALLRVDTENRLFECQPGLRGGELDEALKGTGLYFPPDPSSAEYASFGGMFNTNASGSHSVKYGNVSDYVLDAEIVLSSGEVVFLSQLAATDASRLPKRFRTLYQLYLDRKEDIEKAYPEVGNNVTGYNLRGLVRDGHLHLEKLFSGSEGTLGIVTRLTFRLAEKPAFDSLVIAFFDDPVSSARAVQQILPLKPSGIEIMDKSLLGLAMKSDNTLRSLIPAGIDNLLMVEFDSSDEVECGRMAETVKSLLHEQDLTDRVQMAVSEAEKKKFWSVRKAAVPILYRLKSRKKILALIEDASVPTDAMADYFKGVYDIFQRHGVDFVLYGHIAKGLMHTRPLLDLKDARDVSLLKVLADDVFGLVHSLGGAISGEHGDGRLRSAYIRKQYPDIFELMAETRRILDPPGMFNPDIKTADDPGQMTKDLRYGGGYLSSELPGQILSWPEGFTDEAEKCHGCSKCTTTITTTRMCPVYKFTREEAAAPKAKANVLRALVSGAVPDAALYSKALQDVISRCIGCGSCGRECPSEVDIPKLVLEAKAHRIRRFGPSLGDRVTVNLELAGRTTRKFSRLIEPVMNAGPVRGITEKVTGISRHRNLVSFPARSLFERVAATEGDGPGRVIYFSGCYASWVRPELGVAAVKVLKSLGYTVLTPRQSCCGTPMLAKGMADEARNRIIANLSRWWMLLESADHIVVTCSSCGLALARDWLNLLDTGATRRIADKVIHISRLVAENAGTLDLEVVPQRLAYHQPCHFKVQPDPDCSLDMLKPVRGLEIENLNGNCCGMAGSWGMTADHFELSRQIASDLVARIDASGAAEVVTDCPTCQMQIEQFSSRPVCHPVEIIARRL